MPPKHSFHKGDLWAIRFDDHTEQDDQLADITAYGRVVKATNRMVLLETWGPTDPSEKRDRDQNDYHTYAISRPTIRQAWKLRKEKP